ncbi:FG-GAP repeat protein [Marinicella sediminis]|uniref:FG-GAP repeat protein n=1 Tax=Marinicella sediminis TaxID=1792834 RepID=A0ABV7JE58_9GAMM|nr:FG-GAP repeat protein [Marinicella sediminis]
MNRHKTSSTLRLFGLIVLTLPPMVHGGPMLNSMSTASNNTSTLLYPETGYLDDRFGHAVAIDGSWALAGAPRDDDNGLEAGAAYLFLWSNNQWTQKAKLLAADGEAGDSFGYSVSLSGNTAVIGAVQDDDLGTDSGSAYVFEFDGLSWQQTAKLTSLDGQYIDFFGISISQSENRILIGASHHDAVAQSGGSAYVFELQGDQWVQTARLNAADGGQGDQFGHAVSLSGDRALIGAHQHQINGTPVGAAYLFEWHMGEWVESAKLSDPNGQYNDRFGIAVSLDDQQALIGATGKNLAQGAALVFAEDSFGWRHTATLTAMDGTSGDRFGSAVSLLDGSALIGAPYAHDNLTGAAYQFNQSAQLWQQNQPFQPDYVGDHVFGRSLDQSTGHIIIGATGMDASPSGAGAAHLHQQKLLHTGRLKKSAH